MAAKANKGKMKIQMLHDRVMVRRHEEKAVTSGLIIIPETAREKSLIAEVVAVGPGRKIDDQFYPTSVKPGDRVLLSPSINRTWPDIVDTDGCTVIQEADILALVED